MTNLRKLIKDTGMEIVSEIEYDNKYLYISDYINNKNTVSRYMFVGLSADEFSENFFDHDKYAIFESEVLSPFFYDVDGDLGWNLYLVCVISEHHNLNNAKVVEFEKNDKYVRKLVVDANKFASIIPIGKIISGKEEILDIDPSNDWAEALSNNGLEFCLDDYQTRRLEAYIEGNPVLSTYCGSKIYENLNDKSSNKLQISKVLMNEEYRKHCYGVENNIEFGKVNLFSGANGSGKTSLLEAIELVMTGEIRKKSKAEKNHVLEEQDINSNIQLAMNDGTTMEIPKTAAKRKEQESRLYQNRTGKRDRDKLNNVFHRYNYFTFEEVFAFCYLGDQPDYKQEFSKVIFGEDIQILEKNYQKYRDEFLSKKRVLEKENIKLQENIDSINSVNQNNNNTYFDITKIMKLLEQIDYKYTILEDITNEELNLSWLNKLNIDLNGVQLVFQSLVDEGQKYNTSKELFDVSFNLNRTYDEKLEGYNNELAVIDEYNAKVENRQNERIALLLKKDDKDKQYAKISEQLNLFKENVLIYEDYDKSNRVIELNEIISDRKKQFLVLDIFENRWLKYADENYIVPIEPEKLEQEAKIIQEKRTQISKQLENQTTEIEVEERVNGELDSIISQVKSLGEKYIEMTSDVHSCPLCGSGFDNRIEFEKAVLNIGVRNTDRLKQKYTEKKNNEALLNIMDENYSKIQEQNKDIVEINEAVAYLEKEIPERIVRCAKTLLEKVDIIKSIISFINDQRKQLELFENELSLLEVGIYASEKIEKSIEICNQLSKRNDKKLIKNQVDKILNDLQSANEEIIVDRKRLDEQLNDVNRNLTELNEILEIKTNSVSKQKKELDLLSVEKNNLVNWISEVNHLNTFGITLNENDSFKIVYGKLSKIIEEIQGSKNFIIEIQKKGRSKSEIDKINREIEVNKKYITRCEQSVNILNSLKPSSNYADDFIRMNIEDISDLFGSLHFPKEFDGLGLNDENEIVGYRKTGDNMEKVPIYLMSTGQRTAVVLSIFFKFFNSMKSIPQFILLDEPVSNIDDLNILALLDFLRELVLSKGCQIFFTTANSQVAKLFRRKFSFLRDDFYSYRFERNGNTKTRLFRDYYSEFSNDRIRVETVIQ